ncbi:Uncharacterised protein [Helicobacter canis]|uniref:Uncharacterized protein n=1 Tax=Helicobacter canis TaxID=29419 RepID=A0A377J395_9HELI|nr:Uncharacterised protein [Helicobacter canis]
MLEVVVFGSIFASIAFVLCLGIKVAHDLSKS